MAASLRINHLSIRVRDLTRSADFYRQVLRLPEIECKVGKPNIRWFGIGDDHSIHLIEGDFGATYVTMSTHLCIAVTDLDGTIAHIAGTGTTYSDLARNEGMIHIRRDGVRSIYLQDPDGYWLEISDDY
ncbi:VOC family protein [Neorhizobium galegae]|uniref:VOC family protein n=1 Tax=Neorhizobium galegae TaxID=399 RepID=UPI0006224CC8|nr:VOC family protein [Neorhizobium galegae]CDZ30304.1 Lactoylglutathione lyase-like lyase [Neorhizobium galegae bv. officinalis]KAA9386351.1 glyoxalase [Neorhizobium galegae]KAB1112794.1 glyoxalase [Neorhizobium galegae]MCM2501388.1 VOC family protein [Neorhizobium galegae]MCQ1764567.1 VOC family protein [Neorhizobium galegae]